MGSVNWNATRTSDIRCADGSPRYRTYRVGVCRIMSELRDDKTVRVVAIRYRGDVYATDHRSATGAQCATPVGATRQSAPSP
jgi:hypothetical protein